MLNLWDVIMPSKQPKKPKCPGDSSTSIVTGNIENRNGNVILAGRNLTVTKTTTVQSNTFSDVYQQIEAHDYLSQTQKDDLKAEVAEVEKAIKTPQIDENSLTRHLRNIGRMAPDILDVTLTTLMSPIAGLGKLAEKIAAKAREK